MQACLTEYKFLEARPASSDARCGPSREDASGGPSGQGPEVVGRGDVCPVLCWPVGLLLRICWLCPLLWLLP